MVAYAQIIDFDRMELARSQNMNIVKNVNATDTTLQILGRVHKLARIIFPGYSPNSIKHEVLMLIGAVKHIDALKAWYGTTDNILRAKATERFPAMEGGIYWPYIHKQWAVEKRLAIIDHHYRMIDESRIILGVAMQSDMDVARYDSDFPGLRFVLERAPWFMREGEIVLSVFVNDIRLYSAAFTLGVEGGRKLMYVGALQGSSADNVMDLYRDMTHALYGLRPRDLLLYALKYLANGMALDVIWGICTRNQQHKASYYGGAHKEKNVANYDEIWLEHGGREVEAGFYEVSTFVQFKEMEEIPSRKRSAYRRRYAFLEKLQADFRSACELAPTV